MSYKSRTSNVIKNSSAGILYKLLNIIMQFVLRTIFIYTLGREYVGISTLFTEILTVLSLMELGIGTAIVYALYKPLSENDEKKISALMRFYKIVYRSIGIGVICVGFCCLPFLKYLIKGAPEIAENLNMIFVLYVLTTGCSYFFAYKTSLLRADQQSRIIYLVDTFILLIESIIEITLIVLFKNFYFYLFTRLFFVFIRNIILSNISHKKFKTCFEKNAEKLEKREIKTMFRNIFALGIYRVSGVIIYSTDNIIISAFIGVKDVAIIGNFTLIINSIRMCIEQISESTKSSVGNLVVSSTNTHQKEVFDKINFLAFVGTMFCSTCFFVLLNPFVSNIWLDKSYEISIVVISILVINFFIAVMVYPVEVFRNANGLFIQGKYRPAIMAALNIILDIIFVKIWGIVGVLFATTISRLFTQVWFDAYLIYKNVFLKSVFEYYKSYFIRFVLTALSCALAYYLANLYKFTNVYISFLYKIFIACLIPLLAIYIIYHKRNEFILIKKSIFMVKKKMIKG